MTAITRINTVTPSITPMTEINVMMERNVRFGFRYRSARNRLKGSFNSLLAWRQTQPDSTHAALVGRAVSCAPIPMHLPRDGAHGVTRPTSNHCGRPDTAGKLCTSLALRRALLV